MAMIAMPITMDVPLWADERGSIRVGKSKVLLELVIYSFREGETAESIIESYPSLKLADVYAVIAYYLTHRTEVDAYVAQREAEGDRIQKEIEATYTPEHLALRERLRAFRDENQRDH